MNSKPTLRIVIVNWNAGLQLRECLLSIMSTSQESFVLESVVVVDNASRDNSMAAIDQVGLPVEIIRNPINVGFAAACNQGAAHSRTNYLLFLNPDTMLYTDSLNVPVQFMERAKNDQVGICGIQLVDEQGNVSHSCARFPTTRMWLAKMLGLDRVWPKRFPPHFMLEWDHLDTRAVDQVMGAFFLVRRTLYEALGGFDERFFVYFEEVDFAYRSRLAGWRTYYVAEARAFHRGGGTSKQVRAQRLFYSLRSRIQYAFKHFGWRSAMMTTAGTLALEPLARMGLAIWEGKLISIVETWKGYGSLWLDMPALVLRSHSSSIRNSTKLSVPILRNHKRD